MKKLSIVIPVYNSEKSIIMLIDKIINILSVNNILFEIILVDDCSKDNSWKVLKQLHRQYDNIIIIQLTKNFSEHNAVLAGLNNSSGDYVIIMDDDGQNPPETIPALIKAADENESDVIYTYYDNKKHSIFRNLGSAFANYCATISIKKPKKLYLSSFKLIKRNIVNEIIKYKGAYPYIDGLIFQYTNNVSTLKVEHSERKHGKSNYNIYRLIKLWTNIIFNFSIIPIRFAILTGLITIIFSFIFSGYIILEKLFINPEMPVGYSSIIIIITFIFGIQLFFLGIIGEYIGRLFLNNNNKPLYSIRYKYEK